MTWITIARARQKSRVNTNIPCQVYRYLYISVETKGTPMETMNCDRKFKRYNKHQEANQENMFGSVR